MAEEGAAPPVLRTYDEEKEFKDKLKKEHDEMIKNQIAKHRAFMQSRMPASKETQSAFEKVAYQTGMSPEGQIGEMLTIMITSALMALFGTHYWLQLGLWDDAKNNGLAYEKGADGKFPEIYAQYSEDGSPIGEPLAADQITRDLIRQRGLVPPPSYEEAWYSSWDTYQGWMFGSLSEEQKRRTLMVAGDVHNKTERSEYQKRFDANQAANAANAARQTQKPGKS